MKRIGIYATALATAVLFFLFVPQIDLATSDIFYVPGRGFVLQDWPLFVLLYRGIPWLAWGILLVVTLTAIWIFLMEKPVWRLDRKALVFVIAATALGPGFLANTVLKDHWGRARPSQIEQFGGPRIFTPAPLPAAECSRNCAFVSGHAALGFSLVAFAFLLPSGPPRRAGTVTALSFGAIVGLGRIAQGAHFLSDVVFAGFIIYGMTALLHWWIVEHDGLGAPFLGIAVRVVKRGAAIGWALGRKAFHSSVARSTLVVAATVALIVISISRIDRPVALFLQSRDPDFRELFELIGRLGFSHGYLMAFGLAFLVLHWGGSLPRLRPFAHSMRAFSAIPAFLFLSIAASGIVADLLKPILGRPRPKLLFHGGVYDFAWLELHPNHWSFPSGHSATIVALMTALWFLWPRHILFYILIAMIVSLSRTVVGAHYLSDVAAGALVAVFATRAVALAFVKSGIDLKAARLGSLGNGDVRPWPCRRFGRGTLAARQTELPQSGVVACIEAAECNIAAEADRGSGTGSSPCLYASKPSTIPVAGTPSTRL
jgi:lipid A 4'-phosphatase